MISISKYSGKCDFCDHCEIYGIDKILNNAVIYLYNCPIVPLETKTLHDIIPFYPYLISYATGIDGKHVIHLANESFVTTEEREILTGSLDRAIRYWRRCKRKKAAFNIDDCVKEISFFKNEYDCEIAGRVEELGDKATIDGIHIPFCDSMRQQLYEDMIAEGWSEYSAYIWCFGFDRYLETHRSNN